MLRLSQTLAETWVICTPDLDDPKWNGHVQLAEFNSHPHKEQSERNALEEAAALSFAVLIRSHPARGWEVQSHNSDNRGRMQSAVERALRLVAGPVSVFPQTGNCLQD
jgi:hypothetical protein